MSGQGGSDDVDDNAIIRASNDADAAAEIEIQLTGVKTLTEGDFRY